MTTVKFAGVLEFQLMEMARANRSVTIVTKVTESEADVTPKRPGILKRKKDSPSVSSITFDMNDPNVVRFLKDKTGKTHILSKYPVTTNPSGRKRTLCRKCIWCKTKKDLRNDVGTFCLTCGEDFPLCDNPKDDGSRNCFQEHVNSFKKKSERLQVDKRKKNVATRIVGKVKKSESVELRSRSVKKYDPTAVSTRLAVEIESESSVESNIVSPRKLSLRSYASGGSFRR